MLPATEDKEDLASTQWAAQLDDGLQLLQDQHQILVSADVVREDGDVTTVATSAQEEEGCPRPNSFLEVYGMRRQWLMFFSRAILSGLVCHLSSILTGAETLMGIIFQVLCELLDCVKTRTTPYRPSSNRQVERYNQQVLNFLCRFLQGKQRRWDEYLPVLGMDLQATVNRRIGFTPDMLQLGREVNMPADVILNFPQAEQLPLTQEEYLQKMLSRLQEVQHQAQQHLQQVQLTQKKYYDLKARSHRFSEGDLVYACPINFVPCLLGPILWKLCCLMICIITVGEPTVPLKIITRCSITQTPTGQSKVGWWRARKMVVIYFKGI